MIGFLSGPLFKLSPLIFFVGLIVRLVQYVRGLDWKLEVVNCDDKAFGFHIGTHPAFACKPSECFIEFEKKSFLKGIRCTQEGYLAPLIDGELGLYDFGEKEAGIIPVPAPKSSTLLVSLSRLSVRFFLVSINSW